MVRSDLWISHWIQLGCVHHLLQGTGLLDALQKGKVGAVQHLLREDPNAINQTDPRGGEPQCQLRESLLKFPLDAFFREFTVHVIENRAPLFSSFLPFTLLFSLILLSILLFESLFFFPFHFSIFLSFSSLFFGMIFSSSHVLGAVAVPTGVYLFEVPKVKDHHCSRGILWLRRAVDTSELFYGLDLLACFIVAKTTKYDHLPGLRPPSGEAFSL